MQLRRGKKPLLYIISCIKSKHCVLDCNNLVLSFIQGAWPPSSSDPLAEHLYLCPPPFLLGLCAPRPARRARRLLLLLLCLLLHPAAAGLLGLHRRDSIWLMVYEPASVPTLVCVVFLFRG